MGDKKIDTRISPITGKPINQKRSAAAKKCAANKRKKRKNEMMKALFGGTKPYNFKESDNNKFMCVSAALFQLPDIDLENEKQVEKRLSEFFEIYAKYDVRPTLTGMALALNGMSRKTLMALANGTKFGTNHIYQPTIAVTPIKKAYILMENLWEINMISGKVNPATGIFLGKNNYGYQDVVEQVITPTNNQESISIDDIKHRYQTIKENDIIDNKKRGN